MKRNWKEFQKKNREKEESSHFNLIMTGLVENHACGEMNFQIAGSVRHHMEIENHPHFTWHPHERLEVDRAGDRLLVEIRVENQPIRHQRQRQLHIPGVARADLAGGDRHLPDVVAAVAEDGAAVDVFESDAVRVVDCDVGVEADVEVDAESGDVDSEIEVGDGDWVDGDDRVFRLEDGEGEDEDEQRYRQYGADRRR